ncbi:MAG TPA: FkbM family methyltransferase [Xanthobacteraceae bacterium]|nr:FkbM family methyltransferase [Xanthobacteraceae bacterium]
MELPSLVDVCAGIVALPRVNVVDVGANPLADVKPPYQTLIDEDMASVTGFEPDPEAFERLLAEKGPRETYLPYAIGDGRRHQFRVCAMSGMNSLLPPNLDLLDLLHLFGQWSEVKELVEVDTRRLDDVAEVEAMDYLKIDVQGGELLVFENAAEKLKRCLVVHTEVMFVPMYTGQPLFSEQELALRKLGFLLHRFFDLHGRALKPFVVNGNLHNPLSQVLWADMIFIKDITHLERLQPEQLLKLAVILHYVYKSIDVVHLALQAYDRVTGTDLAPRYQALLIPTAHAA